MLSGERSVRFNQGLACLWVWERGCKIQSSQRHLHPVASGSKRSRRANWSHFSANSNDYRPDFLAPFGLFYYYFFPFLFVLLVVSFHASIVSRSTVHNVIIIHSVIWKTFFYFAKSASSYLIRIIQFRNTFDWIKFY